MLLPLDLIIVLPQQVTEVHQFQFIIFFIHVSIVFKVALPGMFEDLNLLKEFCIKVSMGVCGNFPS